MFPETEAPLEGKTGKGEGRPGSDPLGNRAGAEMGRPEAAGMSDNG